MLQVTKDTIYLYDELHDRRFLIYRKDISFIELIEYDLIGTDLKSYLITICLNNLSRFFIKVNEQTIVSDVMGIPHSEIAKKKQGLSDYTLELEKRADYLEKVVDASAHAIIEIYEEFVNGNNNLECDSMRLEFSMNKI